MHRSVCVCVCVCVCDNYGCNIVFFRMRRVSLTFDTNDVQCLHCLVHLNSCVNEVLKSKISILSKVNRDLRILTKSVLCNNYGGCALWS